MLYFPFSETSPTSASNSTRRTLTFGLPACGWGDRGEQWQAAPEGLKKLIDGYNAAPKEMRPAILDRILNDGQRREQVRELLAEQRQQYRANDRGMSR